MKTLARYNCVQRHLVLKLSFTQVETIGDAYCVASGLHRKIDTHAPQIAWMALRMVETCAQHLTHEGNPIKVRLISKN